MGALGPKQDYQSIVFTLEEAHEVIDVVERGAFDELQGELEVAVSGFLFASRGGGGPVHFGRCHPINRSKLLQRLTRLSRRNVRKLWSSVGASLEVIKQTWEVKKAEDRANRGQLDLFDDIPAGLPLSRAKNSEASVENWL